MVHFRAVVTIGLPRNSDIATFLFRALSFICRPCLKLQSATASGRNVSFRSHRGDALLSAHIAKSASSFRCGLLLQMSYVPRTVSEAHRWAVQKRMNRSRCRLQDGPACPKKPNGVHNSATWRIPLNDLCEAAMRSCVQTLCTLVITTGHIMCVLKYINVCLFTLMFAARACFT